MEDQDKLDHRILYKLDRGRQSVSTMDLGNKKVRDLKGGIFYTVRNQNENQTVGKDSKDRDVLQVRILCKLEPGLIQVGCGNLRSKAVQDL